MHGTLSTTHPIARVRTWFGLSHAELALYLGVSKSLVHALESGTRSITPAVGLALLPLLQQVPAEVPPVQDLSALVLLAATPLVPLPLPAADELAYRRKFLESRATRLRAELARLLARAQAAYRWNQALSALLPVAGMPPPTDADEAQREIWRQDWLHRRARPLSPAAATRVALLRAHLTGLAAEIQKLQE